MFYIVPSFIINILSEITNVVNYDTNGQLVTVIDQFKNLNKISKDINEFKNKLLALNDAGVLKGTNVNTLIKQYEHLDDNILNTARSLALGEKSLDDFNAACNQ